MFQSHFSKESVGLVCLPIVLTLSTFDYIPEGRLNEIATLEAITAIHPLEKCWVEALVKDRLLVDEEAKF